MNTKENLVLEVKPEQLVAYGKLLVAFYDDFKMKKVDEDGNIIILDKTPTLHIHIQNSDDKYSVVKRVAGIKRNQAGNRAEEKRLFARAYSKYLECKKTGGLIDHEKEALKARVAELEGSSNKTTSPNLNTENEKTVTELKADLDAAGIEYKKNASKEALLELLLGK